MPMIAMTHDLLVLVLCCKAKVECPCAGDIWALLPVIGVIAVETMHMIFVEVRRRNEYVTQLWCLIARLQISNKYSSTKVQVFVYLHRMIHLNSTLIAASRRDHLYRSLAKWP
jgi:hypothetical protein